MARRVKQKTVTMGGKLLFPSEYVAAAEFGGKDVTLTIKSVAKESLQTEDGKEQAPVLRFEETTKKMVLNTTNAESIAVMYGGPVEGWPGKRITLYPTRCAAFGDMVDCIRVREKVPPAKGAKPDVPPPSSDPGGEAFAEDIASAMSAGKA